MWWNRPLSSRARDGAALIWEWNTVPAHTVLHIQGSHFLLPFLSLFCLSVKLHAYTCTYIQYYTAAFQLLSISLLFLIMQLLQINEKQVNEIPNALINHQPMYIHLHVHTCTLWYVNVHRCSCITFASQSVKWITIWKWSTPPAGALSPVSACCG